VIQDEIDLILRINRRRTTPRNCDYLAYRDQF